MVGKRDILFDQIDKVAWCANQNKWLLKLLLHTFNACLFLFSFLNLSDSVFNWLVEINYFDNLIAESCELCDKFLHLGRSHLRMAEYNGSYQGLALTCLDLLSLLHNRILDLVVQQRQHHSQFYSIHLFVPNDDIAGGISLLQRWHRLLLQYTGVDERFHTLHTLVELLEHLERLHEGDHGLWTVQLSTLDDLLLVEWLPLRLWSV